MAGSTAAGSGGAAGGTAGSGGAGGVGGGGAGGSGGAEDPAPTLLSKTGLYSDMAAKTLAPGVFAFEPTYALWSDGATKKRWVYMPPGGKIQTDAAPQRGMEFWTYPKGFKLWKEFSRDGKVIETRLLQKLSDFKADWYMVAYKWNDDYTEATAVKDGEMNARQTMHDIPSQKQCSDCHHEMYDHALGFTAMQLSHDDPSGGMTLAKMVELNWFNVAPPATGYKLPGTPVQQKALGYLHANCGMCHNSFGSVYTAKTSMNLWAELDKLGTVETTPAYLSLVCDQWPTAKARMLDSSIPFPTQCEAGHATGAPMDILDISKPKRVVPKDAANSSIHDLMSLRIGGADPIQMPPLGTEVADTMGGMVDVKAWIDSL